MLRHEIHSKTWKVTQIKNFLNQIWVFTYELNLIFLVRIQDLLDNKKWKIIQLFTLDIEKDRKIYKYKLIIKSQVVSLSDCSSVLYWKLKFKLSLISILSSFISFYYKEYCKFMKYGTKESVIFAKQRRVHILQILEIHRRTAVIVYIVSCNTKRKRHIFP